MDEVLKDAFALVSVSVGAGEQVPGVLVVVVADEVITEALEVRARDSDNDAVSERLAPIGEGCGPTGRGGDVAF